MWELVRELSVTVGRRGAGGAGGASTGAIVRNAFGCAEDEITKDHPARERQRLRERHQRQAARCEELGIEPERDRPRAGEAARPLRGDPDDRAWRLQPAAALVGD